MESSLVPPLLNHYKYALLRRRLIQTVLGGPRIRLVPWYIHVIQIVLLLVHDVEITEFDDEEDTVEINSCLGAKTIDYIFSRKRLISIFFHAAVSVALSFVCFYLLLPSVMRDSLPTAGVVAVSVFGWFTLCTAHYSLSVRAPPETAFYRPTDPLELKFLYRPFYVILLGCVYIPLRYAHAFWRKKFYLIPPIQALCTC